MEKSRTKRIKKLIQNKLDKLNAMEGHNLHFELEETKYNVGIIAPAPSGSRFGVYEPAVFFDDFVSHEKAYEYLLNAVETMIAATKLNSPAAYHNCCK